MPQSSECPTVAELTTVTTALSGYHLLADPLLNKGTAFTEVERDAFDLHGLLPPSIGVLDEHISRRLQVLRSFATDLERYSFLRGLHDLNETLFFALVMQNLEEMLPLVYTPDDRGRLSAIQPSVPQTARPVSEPSAQEASQKILANPHFDRVEAIVVTDGERILGLGDQGAGGMGIPIGKLALYTACGGIHPATTLPIMLDVGTDNPECLADPLYVGWRHERVRGPEYDDFVETFVNAVAERWPHVLLQWEDFAKNNATRLLDRYRDRLCTFNDDIQGTAAVATGTLMSASNITKVPLTEQRIVVLGAGSAGCGIAALIQMAMMDAGLQQRDAAGRFFMVDRDGLLVEGMDDIASYQKPFVQKKSVAGAWKLDHPDKVALLDVVRNTRPNVLIGVSGQPGAFEPVVRAMAEHNERPVIFPLSNPTSRAEATPEDLEIWTNGRAVMGTGSPFPPLMRGGIKFKVDQTNNSTYSRGGLGRNSSQGAARHGLDVHGSSEGAD